MVAHCVISYVTLKIDKIYYQPNHLWKEQKAFKKLKDLSGEKPKTVQQWFYQLLSELIDLIMK